MIDWDALLYDPIYAAFGTATMLTPGSGGAAVPMIVIDKTDGIEIDAGPVVIPTIKSAAMIRMAELASHNLTLPDLKDGTLLLGATTWTIKATQPKPGPGGKGTGEALLIFVDGAI